MIMLAIISAVSDNNVIGRQGTLPWNLPEDLKHFKDLTIGHTVIMGSNTWKSLPEKYRPLPGRKNVVLSPQPIDLPEGVERAESLEGAIASHPNEDLFVMGGAMAYATALPLADTLFLTHVNQTITDGDVFFPKVDWSQWKEIEREPHDGYSFVTYKRL